MQLCNFIKNDMLETLRWQEAEGLLQKNNGNDYIASGSRGFTTELPKRHEGNLLSSDQWGHINSQESVGISPDMFHEFFYPQYQDLASQFGLVYYGCCEPVHECWESSIKHLPNLRKVSISAWCDEAYMADQLANSQVIYSRKPSPNFLAIEKEFDRQAFTKYIKTTVDLTQNCKTEYLFRDIYHLNGNTQKISEAIEITKSLTTN